MSKKDTDENIKCALCGAEKEDLTHFMLMCPVFHDVRKTTVELQQPYQ